MANRNFPNSRIYSGHVMPVLIDANFVVTPTNGLGITSLKGPFVQNVFMHTSGSATAGNSNPATPGIAITNPNPAAGVIVIQLQDTYNRLLMADFSAVSPNGTAVSVNGSNLTVGLPYVITDVTATPVASAANWTTLGVAPGITPAVGVTFIAAATGAGTSASLVAPVAVSGSKVMAIEPMGNPQSTIAPAQSGGIGSQLILNCFDRNGSVNAPATGSTIYLRLELSNSSVLVQGE